MESIRGSSDRSDVVTVVGAGLSGCEAAWQIARRGMKVLLKEAKPLARSPAHKMDLLGELVCSNSLKSLDPGTAQGMLKTELEAMGSFMLECAFACRVPAGSALAVDRHALAELVTRRIEAHPLIELEREVVAALPSPPAIVATGPLTEGALADELARACSAPLFFYDAIAPIVDAESIDMDHAFVASRWDACPAEQPDIQDPTAFGLKESGSTQGDYINCVLDQPTYEALVDALIHAEKTGCHSFEEPRYFEACLPAEVMAARGKDVLRHGPMRPVGLRDPKDGKRPHAVLQLRAENLGKTAYNLVGFQTRLTYGEQARVFRMVPALANARFLRYGSIHRNTFLRACDCLGSRLELRTMPGLRIAGLLCGVEGYMESVAMGLLASVMLCCDMEGMPLPPPPPTTAVGGLYHYVLAKRAGNEVFSPTNMNFSLFPPLSADRGGRASRKKRRLMTAQQAVSHLKSWMADSPAAWPDLL